MKYEELSNDELSLLLFFEDCVINSTCKVNPIHMNTSDFEIAKKWNENKFLTFGRFPSSYIQTHDGRYSYYVKFTEQSWRFAQKVRKERGLRQEKRLEELLETIK